jgi:WD40 repeat protein
LELLEEVFCIHKIEDDKFIAGTKTSVNLIHFDSSQKQLEFVVGKSEHSDQVNSVGWFHNEQILISGGKDGVICIWSFNENMKKMEIINKLTLSFNFDQKAIWRIICVNTEGLVLLSNNTNFVGVLKLEFDDKTVEEYTPLNGFSSHISTICWNGKGNIFASSLSSTELYEIEIKK